MDGFFLGANTPGGFFSLYEQELSHCPTKYILKGSPGCGKSTLMKTVHRALSGAGHTLEKIYCSSDPESLDAIIGSGFCIVDGTAPHVFEPAYACANEYYVNLTEYCHTDGLAQDRKKIVSLTDEYKEQYSLAYPLLASAGILRKERTKAAASIASGIEKRAAGIILREFPKRRKNSRRGRKHTRFLTSICHAGKIDAFDHALDLCERVYEIKSDHSLGNPLLSILREAALDTGLDVISCPSPMAPTDGEEQLLIPSIGLAFLTTGRNTQLKGEPYRRILADRCMDKSSLERLRPRLRRLYKSELELMEQAQLHLEEAFRLHTLLEEVYHPHINYNAVSAQAEIIIGELLAD